MFLTDRIVAEKNKLSVEMDPVPPDTTIEAARKQFEILRRLDAQTRLKMMFEMSDYLRSIVEAGVRLRHPEYDERKVNRQVVRLMIGETLFKQICTDAKRKI
ncbi:MAG: hypothetical protein GWN67_18230 [Phycisphaerae bacterium]|nr:hypothetical protein [Phycisphaerae bacterium]NIP55982.1 hypothetical protein [Phycisphaerae bacterium]NIS54547.1 hypothetical protein [Phycisphaerae bacterium]NIU12183.1 hypothetical protein [Phycisphaerae bacterium]NIU58250.1 hypothetical protein [Phycisphaerae bacterium]